MGHDITSTGELRKESVELWRGTHDEWCAHDDADDGIACDCHLSVIAEQQARIEALERAARAYLDAPDQSVPKVMAWKALEASLAGKP